MFASVRRLQASSAYTQLMALMKQDLKQAMLAKNKIEKNTIRSVLSSIKNSEIDGGKQTEFDLYRLFNKMIKQRDESHQLYVSQQRLDLAEVEALESQIIRRYLASLPVASEQEIAAKTEQWLVELREKNGTDLQMKDVMKQVTDEFAQNWNTFPAAIRSLVPLLYKRLWGN
ncbi:altered inheritance of mitochondria protein 41, mitochondrial [Metschnikowia bicuspidata var. bicuspidata NRRL YB-4993]|uniref:Altered inheritance of mitochondria protein 41 n=1 Tax=Metschnikowia bicuspidata var. bicuspidata NRRL YB-4993 TaxID=869754 RepID=A0A1A0HDA1_9ASCO|nr:altered inheritance of mitochondria protein 41, mitochondrial [Metschnikowia bicuspidata var. bicuspidata NRRL YB-4993]OBA21950.1 altered inheritance of mitochondria protein 41, mitochondrial [Metschnikowia bicuspidata var. bicuspidata NRRL YB-4993]